MSIYHEDDHVTLHHGDCLDILATIPDNSIDAVVTDPPYGLSNTTPEQVADTITQWVNGNRDYLPSGRGFMGKEWDSFVPPVAVWDECLRVLKPGGHLLAFAGSRTHDLMTLGIRLAGFDIRDSVAWIYGSGFPKSLNVYKAIDKAAGALRHEAVKFTVAGRTDKNLPNPQTKGYTPPAPATPAARQWEGWGTALKPAFEPVTLARKPFKGTVAANVLEHGTGALNVDACRVGDEERVNAPRSASSGKDGTVAMGGYRRDDAEPRTATGRWPANVVLDEGQAAELDRQTGMLAGAGNKPGSMRTGRADGDAHERTSQVPTYSGGPSVVYNDKGGASRFFYTAKAPKSERPVVDGVAHPTVKPVTLTRWLVRMVTPPGGTVLDPFAGSGTTIEAATLEGFNATGIEREPDYLPLIQHRIERAQHTIQEKENTTQPTLDFGEAS